MTESTKFTNAFSEEVWKQKYCFDDNNEIYVDDTFLRVAKNIASKEKDKKFWTNEFLSILSNFKFVPGGRITSNAGTSYKKTSYINCFVDGFMGKDQDSIQGIYNTLIRQAKILKSEGGYGFCCNVMRPRGANILGIGTQSPGAVKFLELWDKSSEIITAGSGKKTKIGEKGSIRKGAQMVTMSCWHPDIIEFIQAKTIKDNLTKFNMSVLCTDEFMNAVLKNKPWHLVFPNHAKYKKEYKQHWDGDIKKWKELISDKSSCIVEHTFESATELWHLIMNSTYERNEPGVLFVDTMNKMNNLWWLENIDATNPCGEQILPKNGSCLLGSINLTQFIDTDKRDWNYKELKKTVAKAVRFMDNVNDLTYVPLKEQKNSLLDKRRIGLGILGYASALMMCKVRYGSKQALKLTDKLMKCITNEAYKSSALLAKEKGSFKLYDEDKFLQSQFIKILDDDTIKLIKKYGLRNSHLTSIQPTGNSSVYANLVSGGLEPLFNVGFYRTSMQPHSPNGLKIPKNIDWSNQEYRSTTVWEWVEEGDEYLLVTKFEDKVWKFDRSRGLLKEEWVEDYAVRYLKSKNKWDDSHESTACTTDLSVDDHVNTMSIFAKYIDSAISKTINIKNDFSFKDFQQIYINAWKNGIKGFTTYRAGTMAHVLSKESSFNEDSNVIRPKELKCDVHHVIVKSRPYFVLIGLINNKPYEVFAGRGGKFLDTKVKHGTIIKTLRPKGYKAILEDGTELCPITIACTEDEEVISRMASMSLRYNIPIEKIVEQLQKVEGELTSFSKSVSRAFKKYIKDGTATKEECPVCKDESLVYSEGCLQCLNCSWSKCQ